MRNLAGRTDCDPIIEEELFVAGIHPVYADAPPPRGEVPARVSGRLGPLRFERGWAYWIARGEVPLEVAERLYEHEPYGRRDVRVGGHCGRPHPRDYGTIYRAADDRPIYVLSDSDRQAFERVDRGELTGAWADHLRRMRDECVFVETQAEREQVTVRAYVDLYHVDSLAGLKVLADAVRAPPRRSTGRRLVVEGRAVIVPRARGRGS